jgi:glycosyltransferase involved in cell wall biosynthesis
MPMAIDNLILSDIPTPWREPVFERVHRGLPGSVRVVYFRDNERRRLWDFKLGSHPKTILRGLTITAGGGERFFNPGIIPLLVRSRPRTALITASLKDPTAWMALVFCRALGTRIALLCDTWLGRDQGISGVQRMARRIVYNGLGDAFVGASRQTLKMFQFYNPRLRPEQLFLSHLVADNEAFLAKLAGRQVERRFDVMFSGRIAAEKNPEFFAHTCAALKARRGRCRALIIGDGQEGLKTSMREILGRHGVEYEFPGFVPHAKLPDYYAQAKLLLLPTSGDCWGVVLNEAMLAGTPVVTTSLTAAAGELVLDGQNGYVLPLDVELWSKAIGGLLSDRETWERFSKAAGASVADFSFDRAADGILSAFAYLGKLKRRGGFQA